MPRQPLDHRSSELIAAILGIVYDTPNPVPWLELVGQLSTTATPWKTVENTVYDLIAFGALHRIGRPGHTRTPDTRALRPTPLGRAWLERQLLDLPTTSTTEPTP